MAQPEEPMDVDSSMCDFDNKENAYQHGNLPSRTEKGYEELDVAELNMKLRYSMTPTGPMTKSYTVDNRTFDKFADSGSMTQSLHTPLPKSEKPKDLPLQNFTGDHNESRSVLRPLDSTVIIDTDIKVTVSTPHETDEYISLPSSSSSLAHTPEVTTPTKDIKDEGSPIMRGLKSVLNMFRPSQSPIPADEDALKSEVLSPPIVNSPHAPDNNQNNQSLLVSTPLAARKTDMLTKRTSPNKERVVFNEDLEKELLWKDESTILFDDEKVPLHKLFLQNTKQVAPNITANSKNCEKPVNVHTNVVGNSQETGLDSTVEFMDVSYGDKTLSAGQVESDSEFVDCETTFNKNDSLFSAESSFDNTNFLDSTKAIVDKLSAMSGNTVNVSNNTLEASNGTVDLSNVSTVTTQTKTEYLEMNTQENQDLEDHDEDKTLEEVVNPTTHQDQLSVKVVVPEDQLSFKNANQDLETVAAHVSCSLVDNTNDSPIISHPDKQVKNHDMTETLVKENKSRVVQSVRDNSVQDASDQDHADGLFFNSLSQIPLIADPRVLLFNVSSEMTVEDVQVNKNAVESIPSEIPLPDDDELASLPPMNDNVMNVNTTINKAEIVTEDISVVLDIKPRNDLNTNTTMNVVQENIKIDDVSKKISVDLDAIPENDANIITAIKMTDSFAKAVSVGLDPKQNQYNVTKNVEKEYNVLQSDVLKEKTEPENRNIKKKLNIELALSEAGPNSPKDREVEQIEKPIREVETFFTTTEFDATNVYSPPEVLLAPETEKICAHVIPKIDKCNDFVTESFQQDTEISLNQGLVVQIINDATESWKVLDLENYIPENNLPISEESKQLTIVIPKSPKPENYVAPVSDLVIQGTVQESHSAEAAAVQESDCEISLDLSTSNSNVREHVIKTISGSFLKKLNDSIEREKSTATKMKQENFESEINQENAATEMKQEIIEFGSKQENVETEIKQASFEFDIKQETIDTEIKQGRVKTILTQQILETKIEQGNIDESQINHKNVKTEIKQDNMSDTTVPKSSVVAKSTEIIDSDIKSNSNDNEILKTQPKNIDEQPAHVVTASLQPASVNITKQPVASDVDEDVHVNSARLEKNELKEINQNEKITCPIDTVSNSDINSVHHVDNMENDESMSHIKADSGNDGFCSENNMAIVADAVATKPLDFDTQLISHATDDSENNQMCDLHSAPATEKQVEAAISPHVETKNQDCEVDSSFVKHPQDQTLVISAPSIDKKECTDEEIVVSENNSPFVSLTQNKVIHQSTAEINKKHVDNIDSDNFEEIKYPFTCSDQIKAPPKSPPIASKGYNFNFDEIDDPFATKTKIRQSPGLDNSPNQTFSHMDDTLPLQDSPTPQKVNKSLSKPKKRHPIRASKKINSKFDASKTIDTKDKSSLKKDPKLSEKHESPESRKFEQRIQVIEIPHEKIKIKAENKQQREETLTSSDDINPKSMEQSTYFSAGTSFSDSVTKVNFSEINDPNFNPFATKTKIQMSPPPSLNATFDSAKVIIVPEIDDPELNSFASKPKIQSQPRSLNGTFDKSTSLPAKNISSNANEMIINSPKPLSPIPQEVAVHDEEFVNTNVTCVSKTSTMQSVQTVFSVNTEDQDTIEGPFLDEMDLEEVEKMDLDVEDGMFEFGELPPGNEENAEGEIFIDAAAYEFLLNQNQTNATADSGKESLFLKFDPLFAKRASAAGLYTRQSMLKRDFPMTTPQQNTPIATTLLSSPLKATQKSPQQDVTMKTPQKHSPIATSILDSTFEAISTQPHQPSITTQQIDDTFEAISTQPHQPSITTQQTFEDISTQPHQPSITTQQIHSTFVANPCQDLKTHTPLQGLKSPLRGTKTPPHRDLRTPPRDSSFASVSPIAATSKLNKSVDAVGTLGESTDDLNVTIAKPTMVVSPAFNPVVTPRRATPPSRRSVTFTSPAIAVIDRLLSISANNSGLGHHSMLRSPDNEAEEALFQLRELLAEKEMSVQNLRTESKDLRDRLGNLESQMKNLDAVGQERLKKINALHDKLNETLQENKSMGRVVEEYERTIASLITETEQDKKRHAEERMQLISERDEATSHLSSMEISFSDLHSKYEKSKQIIFAFKANDEALKKTQKDFEEKLAKMQSNYESLKQHATAKLNHANEELQKINRAHEAEVLKLNTMLKRKEVDVASLEETLAQKIKTNEELAAICDSLLAKFA